MAIHKYKDSSHYAISAEVYFYGCQWNADTRRPSVWQVFSGDSLVGTYSSLEGAFKGCHFHQKSDYGCSYDIKEQLVEGDC